MGIFYNLLHQKPSHREYKLSFPMLILEVVICVAHYHKLVRSDDKSKQLVQGNYHKQLEGNPLFSG